MGAQPISTTNRETQKQRSTVENPDDLLATTPTSLRDFRRRETDHRKQAARHIGLDRGALAHRRVAVHGRVAIQPGEAFDVNRVRQVQLDRHPFLIERQPGRSGPGWARPRRAARDSAVPA